MEAFLRPTRRSTCSSRTTTTWASAPSRRSRRPARSPARTSRSSRSTRCKDGMQALADGQDQLHRRVQPAARPAADGPRQEGRRGRAGADADRHRGDRRSPRSRPRPPSRTASTDRRTGRTPRAGAAGPAVPAAPTRRRGRGSTPMTTAAPVLDDDRDQQGVPRREGARRRRLPAAPRRGARADGRERRRQVHPDQGADRRLRHRRRHDRLRRRARCASPARCRRSAAGISTVYQEVNLCPNLSVAENIFIGREPRRLGADPAGARCARRAAELLARARRSTSTSRRRWRRTRSPSSRWSRSPARIDIDGRRC